MILNALSRAANYVGDVVNDAIDEEEYDSSEEQHENKQTEMYGDHKITDMKESKSYDVTKYDISNTVDDKNDNQDYREGLILQIKNLKSENIRLKDFIDENTAGFQKTIKILQQELVEKENIITEMNKVREQEKSMLSKMSTEFNERLKLVEHEKTVILERFHGKI